jgi:hypothetical protein
MLADKGQLLNGSAALFFEFEGPTGRLIQDDQYWVATVMGKSAVLLGGSAAYVLGGATVKKDAISPSADPVGSLEAMFDTRGMNPGSMLSANISYMWAMIVKESSGGSFEGLPRARGIAVYAGRSPSNKAQMRRSKYKGEINDVIVGSPIFVEQVG